MAGTTNNRRYPYPGQLDADNVPADIQALAEAVDTDVAAVKATSDATASTLSTALAGAKVIGIHGSVFPGGNTASYTQTMQFNTPFISPPVVVAMLATSQGGTGKMIVTAFATTTTGCTLWARTFDGSNLPNARCNVDVIAIGPA